MRRGVPVNLSPQQLEVLLAVLVVVLAVLLLVGVFELLLTRGAALAVRLSGHKPPRKGPIRVALDELEDRLRGRPE
jgi:hypothetical protein